MLLMKRERKGGLKEGGSLNNNSKSSLNAALLLVSEFFCVFILFTSRTGRLKLVRDATTRI